jgi:4-hydroxybenzoyl-CoA reductase alpha subunit
MKTLHIVGKRTPRIDGIDLVTGHAQYIPDLERPNMLYGVIVRSPITHGRILHIDTAKAERLTGVKAVITGEDLPDTRVGFQMGIANKRPLTSDKVRYIGDEVAAVAAESVEVAHEACSLINVEYEPLPAVFEPELALEPGAPLIHDDSLGNVSGEVLRVFGNVEKGFSKSHRIYETTYRTAAFAHCCMETRGALAEFDPQGRLTLWSPTQMPHVLRQIMSLILRLPISKVRVCKAHIGGAFGSRQSTDPLDSICAFLAQKSGRPVRMIKTRSEEFAADRVRYPMRLNLKTGVSSVGQIKALEADILTDGGAYNEQGLAVTSYAAFRLLNLYRIPCARVSGKVVFTNKVFGGAFRGYGNPQSTFAMESQIDEIAADLGIDPLELRLRNAGEEGEVTVSGVRPRGCGFLETLTQSARRSGWKEKRGKLKRRGLGMASFIHPGGGTTTAHGGNFSSAFIKVESDGSVDVLTGVPDVGQGSDTTLAQIAAEELGVTLEAVRVHAGDTAITPPTLGVRGSRETFMAGNAVRMAAHEAKLELLKRAASVLDVDERKLDSANGRIYVKSSPERNVTIAEAAAKTMFDHVSVLPMGVPILASACYTDPVSEMPDAKSGYGNFSPTWAYGTQVAEVEVDIETGEVTVLEIVAAHDVGKAINPMAIEGQLEGSISQGVGMALTEKVIWEEGFVLTQQLADYKLPTTMDVPKVTTVLIETEDSHGPFGAKGVGEAGLVPTPAAIANAIYDAVGVRIRELPITRDEILTSLKLKGFH